MGTDRTDETYIETQDTERTYLDTSGSIVSPEKTILLPGETFATDYVVLNQMGDEGAQSTVYVAQKDGKQFVIKLFNKGNRPSEEITSLLKNHICPFVADLIDYGFAGDSYFEIYRYYVKGTLDKKGKCTISFMKDILIPNMNEGLRFLHTLGGKGIVHGDIKPSNIFLSDDETKIIIGDFGISSYMDQSGKLIDEIKGTPEYAPRTVSFFGKTTKTLGYDYGALGLLLIKVATGHSLFEGLNTTEITKIWEAGLEIPESIESRLRRLIAGLLIEDENKRFGYEEVKKWCEGEYVRILDQSIYTKEELSSNKDRDPLVFGIFDNKVITVANFPELSEAISSHWEHAKKVIQREIFFDFIRQFSEDLEKEVRGLCENKDKDIALFQIIYRTYQNQNLVYKGKDYGTAIDFVNALDDHLSEDQLKIIYGGLFEFYLKQNGYDQNVIEITHSAIAIGNKNATFVPLVLYYLFQKEKVYVIKNQTVQSLDGFIEALSQMDVEEIETITNDTKLLAWLYAKGYNDGVLKFFDL